MKKLTLIISFLSVFAITNAQMVENTILDSVSIQKNELIVTQEIEEMVVRVIKNNTVEEYIYPIYGIKNKSQLEHLQLGKPIPLYIIANEELKSASMGSKSVDIFNVSRMTDGAPLSLEFTNSWAVPIMYDGEPLSFGHIQVSDFEGFGGYSFMSFAINSTIEQFHNYVHKDLIIGYLNLQSSRTGMDYLIIRKDNKEIFVELCDEETKEYYKNEYNFSELINRLKALNLRKEEARNRYYAQVATKIELEITPEITEMVISKTYSLYKDVDEERLSDHGITHRPQLENLQLGKPIPMYYILEGDNLTFIGVWQVPVMSGDEPFCFTRIRLEEDEKYRWVGTGATRAEPIHNYEHKDLIIGFLDTYGMGYLIIRRENKDIFVEIYNYGTREYLKNEYSFSELLNHLKK